MPDEPKKEEFKISDEYYKKLQNILFRNVELVVDIVKNLEPTWVEVDKFGKYNARKSIKFVKSLSMLMTLLSAPDVNRIEVASKALELLVEELMISGEDILTYSYKKSNPNYVEDISKNIQ
jgi:hypothetical protein